MAAVPTSREDLLSALSRNPPPGLSPQLIYEFGARVREDRLFLTVAFYLLFRRVARELGLAQPCPGFDRVAKDIAAREGLRVLESEHYLNNAHLRASDVELAAFNAQAAGDREAREAERRRAVLDR